MVLESQYNKLICCLCYFHSILIERKKFGEIGFSIPYDFSESDFYSSLFMIEQQFLGTERLEEVPLDTLFYLVSEINYGGRIIEFYDRRLVQVILKKYINKEIFSDKHHISTNFQYDIPKLKTIHEFENTVNNFPIQDDIDLLGFHQNALISLNHQHSGNLINQIKKILVGSKDQDGESESMALKNFIESIKSQEIPKQINQ